jgi:hypothetical protein
MVVEVGKPVEVVGTSCYKQAAEEDCLGSCVIDTGARYALGFDGANDYLTVSDNASLDLESFTIETWIRAADTQGSQRIVVKGHDMGESQNRNCDLRIEDGIPKFNFEGTASGDGPDFWLIPSGVTIQPGDWHHLAVTFDASTMTGELLLDGTQIASEVSTFLPNQNIFQVSVGANYREDQNVMDYFFNGQIDEIRIWNIARTETEIQQSMYNTLNGNETGLVGYWRLDEGEGQVAYDSTSNHNDGQLGSSPSSDSNDPLWVASDAPVFSPSSIVTHARLDIGMPYNTDRGCQTPYTGCGGPYHGFYAGVCTDLAMDAYKSGAPFSIQDALHQDHLAHPGRYQYGTARWVEDMRRYFRYNQPILPHDQPYQIGDIAFFDWSHVGIISEVDTDGRPLRLVHATGVCSVNPSGLAFEQDWNSYYDQHTQGHGRLDGLNSLATSSDETLQILCVSLNSPSVALYLRDANGKSTSDTYDENLVASNVEAFVPYVPGGTYSDLGAERVITVTQPISNTTQYYVELKGQASATYNSPFGQIYVVAANYGHTASGSLDLEQNATSCTIGAL